MSESESPRPSTFRLSDPAHPSQPNTDHTTTAGGKPTTLLSAITSPTFFPTLTDAPFLTRAASHGILLLLVSGGIFSAYIYGFDLFQVANDGSTLQVAALLGGLSVVVTAALVWTGTANVDFFALVGEFWWLTMPAAMAATLALVLMKEGTAEIKEVQ